MDWCKEKKDRQMDRQIDEGMHRVDCSVHFLSLGTQIFQICWCCSAFTLCEPVIIGRELETTGSLLHGLKAKLATDPEGP